MSEWIEKKEAIKAVGHCDIVSPFLSDEFFQSLKIRNAAITAINNIPAADVAPVVHGKWREYEAFPLAPSMNGYPCSNCGMHFSASNIPMLNYCPNCGAKMDGGE